VVAKHPGQLMIYHQLNFDGDKMVINYHQLIIN